MAMKEELLTTDVLVLGTGGAGVRAAVEAAQQGVQVLVVSKMGPEDTNCTISAWGGFTYAPEGKVDELFRQVVETGGFLNNQRLAEVFAKETPRRMRELSDLGMEMEILDEADKKNQLGIVKLRGKGRTTGLGMTRPLRAKAESLGARFLDHVMISTLVTEGTRVIGAIGVHLVEGSLVTIAAKAVIVATGGGACLFERTDNPPGTTADGIALAYDAGAELVDLECISFQFPKRRLDEVFAVKQAPNEDLLRTGAAHYYLGGIRIDERCRTTLEGLYAAGEAAGGVFGAARLGGAAMADIVVFGAIAGKEAADWAKGNALREPRKERTQAEGRRLNAMLTGKGPRAADVISKLRTILWRNCGTMKTKASLELAARQLDALDAIRAEISAESVAGLREGLECLNMITIGALIAMASLLREETRCCFWRLDHPKADNEKWLKNIHLWKANGKARHETRPVVMTRMTAPSVPKAGAGCYSYIPQAQ